MLNEERCLWCGRDLSNGLSCVQLLTREDQLCGSCRAQLMPGRLSVQLEDVSVLGLYWYDECFSSMLIQYKECLDEALQDVFIAPAVKSLRRSFAGCTLIPMPSSSQKQQTRGFATVSSLFSALKLPVWDGLEKTSDYVQSGNAEQRRQNQQQIRLKPGMAPPEGPLILADDVLTTGATLLRAHQLIPAAKRAVVLAVNCRFQPPAPAARPHFF